MSFSSQAYGSDYQLTLHASFLANACDVFQVFLAPPRLLVFRLNRIGSLNARWQRSHTTAVFVHTFERMSPDQEELISRNLVALLRANLVEGQEAEVAIHPELRRVLVFVDDELVLTCGFDELLAGPGGSLN